ncbi:MAG: hypothetical protein K2L56_05850 [Prevotella sp.]|nr:hypothetical protein [Prevotella sp.]
MVEKDLIAIRKYLNDTGMYIFINILYPALKKSVDIDFNDVCRMYPEYAERVKSDKSKKTRLSKAKSILRNGWEKDALTIIADSKKIDYHLVDKAKKFLSMI